MHGSRLTPSDDRDDDYLSVSGPSEHNDKHLEHEYSFCSHPADWGNCEVENKNGHGSAHVFVFCAVNPNQEEQQHAEEGSTQLDVEFADILSALFSKYIAIQ